MLKFGGQHGSGPVSGERLPRGFWGRLLENPENPLGWSLRLFRVRGIIVRVHLLTVVYMLAQVLWSIPPSHGGLVFVAPAMAALFVVVLLHEFGHCLACRHAGGDADRIVMLPWGGLALTRPIDDWRAHMVTTLGGPMVNLTLLPITAGALWLGGMGDAVLFNPFSPLATLVTVSGSGSTALGVARVTLWWLHYANVVVLALNMLLPMYPFDAGRIIQALLWRRSGYRRSMELSVLVGFGGAMVLGVFALLVERSMLVLIAVFGAAACWTELRRVRGEADLVSGDLPSTPPPDDEPSPGESARDLARQRAAELEQAELDRVLAKIAVQGMSSLTRGERRTLERATRERQKGTGRDQG